MVVVGAFAEVGMPDDALHALAAELRTLAQWLGLGHVEVGERGDLVLALGTALKRAAD